MWRSFQTAVEDLVPTEVNVVEWTPLELKMIGRFQRARICFWDPTGRGWGELTHPLFKLWRPRIQILGAHSSNGRLGDWRRFGWPPKWKNPGNIIDRGVEFLPTQDGSVDGTSHCPWALFPQQDK